MGRLAAFQSLKDHSFLGKVYKKLSKQELFDCEKFIIEGSELDDNEFESAVNRWFLDRPKPKNWTAMMELVSSSKIK